MDGRTGCCCVLGPEGPCINTCKTCRKAPFVQDLRQEGTTWVQSLSKQQELSALHVPVSEEIFQGTTFCIKHWERLLAGSCTQSSVSENYLHLTHTFLTLFLFISLFPSGNHLPWHVFSSSHLHVSCKAETPPLILPQDNVNRINKPQWLYQSVCSSPSRTGEGALVSKYI